MLILNLQVALSNAVSGDQIWVSAGEYKPGSNRTDSFVLKNGVAVYGGFPASGNPNMTDRNWETNVTTMTGDLNDNGRDDNDAYHVVYANGVDPNTVLDGFTITAGNANGDFSSHPYFGGGMFFIYSSPTVTNCTFSFNSAGKGGGMSYNNSNPKITNCFFINNTSESRGGGIYNTQSNPILGKCTFSGNSAVDSGGGMYNGNSDPQLINCNFINNSSSDSGGGMYNYFQSSPTLINCIFSGNSASDCGGGMYNFIEIGSTYITNCTFICNLAGISGGGMYDAASLNSQFVNCIFSGNTASNAGGLFNGGGNTQLINCMFNGNSASDSGGGIYNSGPIPQVINCTFSGNTANYAGGMYNNMCNPKVINCTLCCNAATINGGGMGNYSSCPTVINCIIWGNTAPIGPQIFNSTGDLDIYCSDVQGGWMGQHNIDTDPNFIRNPHKGTDGNWGTSDDDYGNLRLNPVSPCIEAGCIFLYPDEIIPDPDGNPRIIDGDCDGVAMIDMGAYEFSLANFGDFDGDCNVNLYDYSIFAAAWMTNENDPRWNVICDINVPHDKLINLKDLAVFCQYWLKDIFIK